MGGRGCNVGGQAGWPAGPLGYMVSGWALQDPELHNFARPMQVHPAAAQQGGQAPTCTAANLADR